MNLDEVDGRLLDTLERCLDLCPGSVRIRHPATTAGHIELRGPEDPLLGAHLLDDLPGHLLRSAAAVTGCGVEQRAAVVEQRVQDAA